MFDQLQDQPRLLIQAELSVIQGDRFQPTGFPDLGAAVYRSPEGKRMLLVESAQSMANRLEKTCLDGDGPHIAKELEGLPYVVGNLSGATETQVSTLVEAHRLNSPFIISDKEFKKEFMDRCSYAKGHPLDWQKIAEAILYSDPNSLLHGLFMANLEDGRIKVPRAISGFIEADDVQEVASGGVKNTFNPSGDIRAENHDKDVYSNVPFHRTEFTAGRITAYFNFDLSLLDGYRLDKDAKHLLIALGLYKISRFLESGLRLRTACDFDLKKEDIEVTAPFEWQRPSSEDLLKRVQECISACKTKGLFADPPVRVIETKTVKKSKTDTESAAEEPTESDEE